MAMTSSPSLNCRDVDVYLYDNHTLEARSRTNIGIDDALLDEDFERDRCLPL
jgi:hypothetical protein